MIFTNQVALTCTSPFRIMWKKSSLWFECFKLSFDFLFPFAHLTFIDSFAVLQHWTYWGKKSKIYPFRFLTPTLSPVSIPSTSRWLCRYCWCYASYPVREYCHEVEHKELPLPTVTVSEQVLSVFLLTIAQILSLLAFSISICSLFLYSFCLFWYSFFFWHLGFSVRLLVVFLPFGSKWRGRGRGSTLRNPVHP